MKIKLGVIFGGVSVEHEVSIITAIQAMESIDSKSMKLSLSILIKMVYGILALC